jgi:hypothetical protein
VERRYGKSYRGFLPGYLKFSFRLNKRRENLEGKPTAGERERERAPRRGLWKIRPRSRSGQEAGRKHKIINTDREK